MLTLLFGFRVSVQLSHLRLDSPPRFRFVSVSANSHLPTASAISDRDAQGEDDRADSEAEEGPSRQEDEKQGEEGEQETLQSQCNPVLHSRMLWNPKHKAVPHHELSADAKFFLDCVVDLVMQEEVVALSELGRREPV